MTLLALLGHAWKRHRVTLAVVCVGLFVFQWMITRFAPVASQGAALQQLLNLMPPALIQMFGNEVAANLNPRGALSFGWAHPFAIVLPAAWAVRISAAALAGEIGEGTIDLVASKRVARGEIVIAALITLASGLLVIAFCGWLGTASGVTSRPELEIVPAPFLFVAGEQSLMFFAFGAIGLLISSRVRHGGRAIGISSAIIAVSFALYYVARAWQPIAWLRPASLFYYYRPQHLVREGFTAFDVLPLAAVALAASAGAFAIFSRRDL